MENERTLPVRKEGWRCAIEKESRRFDRTARTLWQRQSSTKREFGREESTVRKSRLVTGLFLALAMVVLTQTTWPQQARVLAYSLRDAPHDLVVTRGTVLELSGPLDALAAYQTVQLRRGDQVRASGTFARKWTLRWNTAGETLDWNYISLWQIRPNGTQKMLGQLHVRILEAPPFRIQVATYRGGASGPTTVQVRAMSTEKAAQIALTLDTSPWNVSLDPDGKTTWDASRASPGLHIFAGTVRLTDGSLYVLEPVGVMVVGKLQALPFAVGTTLDLATLNGNLTLRARIDPSLQPKTVSYLVDGK